MAKPSPTYSGASVLVKFGKRVRVLRESQGVSQEAIALACGIDRSYFGGIERGEHNLALVNIEKIANALNVKIRDLFS